MILAEVFGVKGSEVEETLRQRGEPKEPWHQRDSGKRNENFAPIFPECHFDSSLISSPAHSQLPISLIYALLYLLAQLRVGFLESILHQLPGLGGFAVLQERHLLAV